MSFKDFLKDKLGFLVYNFTFLIFTVSVIIFSPVDVFLTDTILYILVVNVVFLFLYLFISYIKKNKFLDKIKNDTVFYTILTLPTTNPVWRSMLFVT
ncbi:hypothetical protein BGV21_14220 [Clostridioides difficile]|nr:hypothetical protein BGV21_14220 [Clostridioides difficile]